MQQNKKGKLSMGETKIYQYTVILEKEEDGGYHVFCPALVGCHTQGDTFDEAMENIKDAIKLYIESLKAHKEPIPWN